MSFRSQYYNGAMYFVFEYADKQMSEKTVIVYPSLIPDGEFIDGKTVYRYKEFQYGGDGRYLWCGFGFHNAKFSTMSPVYVEWDRKRQTWYESDSEKAIPAWVCREHAAQILPF